MSDVIKRLKGRAKDFRSKYKLAYGEDISHGHSLERVSKMMGFRNWNTLCAIAKKDPSRIEIILDIPVKPTTQE